MNTGGCVFFMEGLHFCFLWANGTTTKSQLFPSVIFVLQNCRWKGWERPNDFQFISTYKFPCPGVCFHYQGGTSNRTKPASGVCHLCSSAENIFLFFPKKKLLLNLREMELLIPGKTFVGNKN